MFIEMHIIDINFSHETDNLICKTVYVQLKYYQIKEFLSKQLYLYLTVIFTQIKSYFSSCQIERKNDFLVLS